MVVEISGASKSTNLVLRENGPGGRYKRKTLHRCEFSVHTKKDPGLLLQSSLMPRVYAVLAVIQVHVCVRLMRS